MSAHASANLSIGNRVPHPNSSSHLAPPSVFFLLDGGLGTDRLGLVAVHQRWIDHGDGERRFPLACKVLWGWLAWTIRPGRLVTERLFPKEPARCWLRDLIRNSDIAAGTHPPGRKDADDWRVWESRRP